MSKGNLFLGFARGKVGDVVFSRAAGEQVARARNRAPKNPQSPLQMLQRVVLKTSSTAYSMLQPICNHSFQGRAEGTENQSRFAELNIAAMRLQLRDVINSGDPEEILQSTETNFAGKYASLAQIRPYIVSEGTLPPTTCQPGNMGTSLVLSAGETPTYQQVVDALGLSQGDQLTFLQLSVDDRTGVESSEFNGFQYARVILEPASGDMTTPFLQGTAVNSPNERNEGTLVLNYNTGLLTFNVGGLGADAGLANTAAAGCVIVSRLVGGTWARSTQALVINTEFAVDHSIGYLYDAIYSFLRGTNSSLYLNQAEGF